MTQFFQDINIFNMSASILMFFTALLITKRISNLLDSQLAKKITLHQLTLFKRSLHYLIVSLFLIMLFKQLGMDIGVLIGAAGIFSVAISFASKTSASNLVSGIFLLIEHPFRMGDIIKVKNHTGIVTSIDLLSTKIKTDDNTLIRISNEELIRSEIINLSHFANKKSELIIEISYESDIDQYIKILLEITNNHLLALKTPKPSVIISSFKDSAIELKLSIFTHINHTEQLKAELRKSIYDRFKKEKLSLFKFSF